MVVVVVVVINYCLSLATISIVCLYPQQSIVHNAIRHMYLIDLIFISYQTEGSEEARKRSIDNTKYNDDE